MELEIFLYFVRFRRLRLGNRGVVRELCQYLHSVSVVDIHLQKRLTYKTSSYSNLLKSTQ